MGRLVKKYESAWEQYDNERSDQGIHFGLSAAGLAPKAVIVAVMRKLAHFIYGVVKSGKPFDTSHGLPILDFQDGI